MVSVAERNLEITRSWRESVELAGAWRKATSQAGGLLVGASGEAKQIEGIPDELIANVVHRVPWQWLPDEEKQVILAGLIARRRLVRDALESYLGGSS